MLSPDALDALGHELGLCRRRREIAPGRLATSLLASFADGRVETVADLLRQFNALHGRTVSYRAFRKQLAKPEFAAFAHALFELVAERWAMRTLRAAEGLAGFDRVVIQDGSSFAVKDALRKRFPGRFKTISPAAVELHATMELLAGTASRTALTADTEAERRHLPDADSLADALLLVDRGYFNVAYLAAVALAGGHFGADIAARQPSPHCDEQPVGEQTDEDLQQVATLACGGQRARHLQRASPTRPRAWTPAPCARCRLRRRSWEYLERDAGRGDDADDPCGLVPDPRSA